MKRLLVYVGGFTAGVLLAAVLDELEKRQQAHIAVLWAEHFTRTATHH